MPSILLELESILLYSYGQIHYSMAGRVRGLSSCLCGNYNLFSNYFYYV